MHVHNCEKCGSLCASVHPWCLFCRADQRAQVQALCVPAERPEQVSPMIVREIDAILARHNRRDVRASRRKKAVPLRRALGYLGGSVLALYLIVAVILGTFALVDQAAFALGFHKEIR